MALGIIVLLLAPLEIVVTVGVYLLIGAIGFPVFDAMKGGLGIILGPTGGYLIGFFVGATIAAIIKKVAGEKLRGNLAIDALLLFVTLLTLYLIGWAQLGAVANLDMTAALFAGVIPFLIPEAGKLVVVILSVRAVRMALGAKDSAKKEQLTDD
jgi:biotin transport system substrate-specific component